MTVASVTGGRLALAFVVTLTGGCLVVKIDTSDSLTDVSLSDILTDGFTLTSAPTDSLPTAGPGSDPSTQTDTTVTDTTATDTTVTDTTATDTTVTDTDTTATTIVPPVCGDGSPDPGEACDDGDQDNSDDCLETCEMARCGDGFLHAGVEDCDDGNDISGDGCEPGCGFGACGDGFVQDGESCDDGNNSNTDACLATCVVASCGDGFVRAGVEDCEDGNASNTDACVADCTAASCGDGFLQAGVEDCDDGNDVPADGCDQCISGDLPVECQGVTVLQESSRNVNSGIDDVECDLELPDAGQWSRFSGPAGTTMPTTAPPTFTCGTHAPGWLSGTIPGEADGIVARDVCFHWEGDTCNWKVPISVRNCGPFVMFKLAPVPSCALRYCGADG